MHPDRIAELLEPFLGHSTENAGHGPQDPYRSQAASATQESGALSATQLQNISTYIDLLLHWNSRINLTSVRRPEEIVTRHFGESLFAARHLFPLSIRMEPRRSLPPVKSKGPGQVEPGVTEQTKPHVIDVGSGAGFPGLPIKIWAPRIHLTLIESNHKKATFLREVVRATTLTNVDVFTGRAEDFREINRSKAEQRAFTAAKKNKDKEDKENGDVVTLRAVDHFDSILPAAVRLVTPSGRLAILIGQNQTGRAHELVPNLQWDAPIRMPLSSSRVMIIGRNVIK